jgi:hypothetical protein
MSAQPNPTKQQNYRKRMRERGMRLVQIWVPDVRSKAFAAEAHRQSLVVSTSPQEAEEQAFVAAISEIWSEEETR